MGRVFANDCLRSGGEWRRGLSGLVGVRDSTSGNLVTRAEGFAQAEEADSAGARRIAGPTPRPRL
jgi:hypothetical protein